MRDLFTAFSSLDPVWRALILLAVGVAAHLIVLAAEHATVWLSCLG